MLLFLLFADSRRAVINYWQVLANRLGGLSLPRKSVVRLTDHHDMTDNKIFTFHSRCPLEYLKPRSRQGLHNTCICGINETGHSCNIISRQIFVIGYCRVFKCSNPSLILTQVRRMSHLPYEGVATLIQPGPGCSKHR